MTDTKHYSGARCASSSSLRASPAKGRIEVGADAGLTVFDLATALDRAICGTPFQPSAGVT
ncbi:MAG: hypothetical protein CL908_19735 [Deltaproteobacteria bacterium]|nr:hypothetical protein [Deltaproteobacteria bacterium]